MGYTHSWQRVRELPAEAFAAAVADCRRVCEALPIPLGDSAGEGEPEFSPECVCFNGSIHSEAFSRDGDGIVWPTPAAAGVGVVGADVMVGKQWCAGQYLKSRAVNANGDGSYETFLVQRVYEPQSWQKPQGKHWREFCKTNYRPYDLCVQCCLIALKEHLGDLIRVKSDGTNEQWNEARDACQVFLGYGLLFALDD